DRRERERGGELAVASQPAPGSLEAPDRAGEDRLALEEAREVVGERLGRRVAARGLLGEAAERDRLEVERDLRVHLARRDRLVLEDLLQHLGKDAAAERELAHERAVKDDARRVDVA